MHQKETIELDAETLTWYVDKEQEREQIAEEARADQGEITFAIGECLRTSWSAAQRADKSRICMFQKKAAAGHRIASDGLLERQVAGAVKPIWVPIVPEGQATSNLTWKRWVFLQCHVGMLGAHRNAKKTTMIIIRQCWWESVSKRC